MARRPGTPATVAVHVALDDAPGAIPALAARVADAGGTIRTLSTVRRRPGEATSPPGGRAAPECEIELEVEGLAEDALLATLDAIPGVRGRRPTRALGRVFGKRIIVVGGGAQVAQVALGAVSEADRHNLRGELISVDTIPLVGEEQHRGGRARRGGPATRAPARPGRLDHGRRHQHRGRRAARRAASRSSPSTWSGSITEHVDLVVSDPVQAGTMAVMAIADTAAFDLERQRGRRY